MCIFDDDDDDDGKEEDRQLLCWHRRIVVTGSGTDSFPVVVATEENPSTIIPWW
jgi:hypothetical protein